jgi:hypothetical protein
MLFVLSCASPRRNGHYRSATTKRIRYFYIKNLYKILKTLCNTSVPDPTGWTIMGSSPRNSNKTVQTGSGAHPASYSVGTDALSPCVKWPGREVDHIPTSSTDLKNEWSYTSTHPIRLHGVNRDSFTSYILLQSSQTNSGITP